MVVNSDWTVAREENSREAVIHRVRNERGNDLLVLLVGRVHDIFGADTIPPLSEWSVKRERSQFVVRSYRHEDSSRYERIVVLFGPQRDRSAVASTWEFSEKPSASTIAALDRAFESIAWE